LLSNEGTGNCPKKCDTVVRVLGPRPPHRDIFCEETTQTVIGTMHAHEVSRIICQAGAMIGACPENRTLAVSTMTSMFNRSLKAVVKDRACQERAVMKSGHFWAIVKITFVNNKHPKGARTVGPDVRIGFFHH
jgi:hypothetical protein